MGDMIARTEKAINEYDSALLDNLDLDDAVKMIIGRLTKEKQRAEAAEADLQAVMTRAAMLEEALGPNARILNKRRDDQIKQLEEAILSLADELEFKPSQWSDLLTAIRARK